MHLYCNNYPGFVYSHSIICKMYILSRSFGQQLFAKNMKLKQMTVASMVYTYISDKTHWGLPEKINKNIANYKNINSFALIALYKNISAVNCMTFKITHRSLIYHILIHKLTGHCQTRSYWFIHLYSFFHTISWLINSIDNASTYIHIKISKVVNKLMQLLCNRCKNV